MKISKNILLLTLLNLIVPVSYADTIYVNLAVAAGGNGTSWGQAFKNLQSALDVAGANDQIWIAQGTYYPSKPIAGDSRLKTFNLPNNVLLYGGFKGNEDSLNQRNPLVFKTILSGDLNHNDVQISDANYATSIVDNVYHVLTMANVSTTLDGLTVQSGNASGASGGAMLINSSLVTINNVTVQKNESDVSGGALQAYGPNTTLDISDSIFTTNRNRLDVAHGGGGGGAINLQGDFVPPGTNPLPPENTFAYIKNSKFTNNIGGEDGGALQLDNTTFVISDSDISNNETGHSAGGAVAYMTDGGLHHLAFNNTHFGNNTAHSFSGAISLYNFGNPNNAATFDKTVFQNNQTTFKNDGVFRLGGDGGALTVEDTNTTITNSFFLQNTAQNGGGAVLVTNFNEASSGATTRSSVTISNTLFSGNKALAMSPQLWSDLFAAFGLNAQYSLAGGAIRAAGQAILSVDKCIFSNNNANGNGGAIASADINVFFSPPGIYVLTDGTATITNSVFFKNTAAMNGGAISSVGLVPDGFPVLFPPTISVSGSKFLGNTSAIGNAIYTKHSTNTLNNNNYGPQQNAVVTP